MTIFWRQYFERGIKIIPAGTLTVLFVIVKSSANSPSIQPNTTFQSLSFDLGYKHVSTARCLPNFNELYKLVEAIMTYIFSWSTFWNKPMKSLKSRHSWRRQWHPTPVLLPGKSHGRRSVEGCSPWGRWGSDTTEQLHFRFSLSYIGEGNGNPLQRSCLENPSDGGAWWAAVYGVAQSRTQLKWLSIV